MSVRAGDSISVDIMKMLHQDIYLYSWQQMI